MTHKLAIVDTQRCIDYCSFKRILIDCYLLFIVYYLSSSSFAVLLVAMTSVLNVLWHSFLLGLLLPFLISQFLLVHIKGAIPFIINAVISFAWPSLLSYSHCTYNFALLSSVNLFFPSSISLSLLPCLANWPTTSHSSNAIDCLSLCSFHINYPLHLTRVSFSRILKTESKTELFS